uniref:Uncharacterized protein n=1 Tax=Arundo donax TaxID=35708 RepID=A0A0A8XXI7_ARUDO
MKKLENDQKSLKLFSLSLMYKLPDAILITIIIIYFYS